MSTSRSSNSHLVAFREFRSAYSETEKKKSPTKYNPAIKNKKMNNNRTTGGRTKYAHLTSMSDRTGSDDSDNRISMETTTAEQFRKHIETSYGVNTVGKVCAYILGLTVCAGCNLSNSAGVASPFLVN